MISNRAAGGVRTVIFRSFGRLYSKSSYFFKCMKNTGKARFFKWSGRSSWSLGHKVVPERGRDSQNDVEQRRERGQSSKSRAGQVRLSGRAMGRTGNHTRIKSSRRSKSMYTTIHMIRSSIYTKIPASAKGTMPTSNVYGVCTGYGIRTSEYTHIYIYI